MKTKWMVLGLTDALEERNLGTLPTKKAAEALIVKRCPDYKEFGLGLIRLDEGFNTAQWNYTILGGEILCHRNHNDLW